jgi:BlaI family penicillinase repressor
MDWWNPHLRSEMWGTHFVPFRICLRRPTVLPQAPGGPTRSPGPYEVPPVRRQDDFVVALRFFSLTYDDCRTNVISMVKRNKADGGVQLPTEAELEILTVLWERGAATVREVHEALSGKGTGYTTVLKQMQVMVEKGLLKRSERFRSHVYEARARREQTQQRLAGNLLERAFGGSAANLVLGALASQKVSAEELAEIRRVLDEFEKEAK